MGSGGCLKEGPPRGRSQARRARHVSWLDKKRQRTGEERERKKNAPSVFALSLFTSALASKAKRKVCRRLVRS